VCRPDLGDVGVGGAVDGRAVDHDEDEEHGDGGLQPALVVCSKIVFLQHGFADERERSEIAADDCGYLSILAKWMPAYTTYLEA